jgi:DNA polymerase III subunit beta
MELTTNKTELAKALANIAGAISPRTTLPILGNVLIQANGSELKMTSTDLDLILTVAIKADVKTEGECTLPAKRLSSVIREMPTESVSIKWNDSKAEIKSGDSRVKLIGLESGEFPTSDAPVDRIAQFSIDCELLESIIRRTHHSASIDESRYVLNGILIESTGDGLLFIATDGRRLAKVDLPLDGCPPFTSIIPNKTVALIHRTMTSGKCGIEIYPGQAAFTANGSSIRSKLIEGNFPNWRQVIPGYAGETAKIEREALLAAVKRVGLMADEKTNSVKFALTENQVTISVNSQNIGEATESIDCQCSITMTTSMNPHFVTQLLSGLKCDMVSMSILDDSSPIVFSDESFQSVIMPMRAAN